MGNEKLFSKHYSNDNNRYEDQQKFRDRILKYLEDFVNSTYPVDTSKHCRTEMGIDLDFTLAGYYCVEDTFLKTQISDILDFITVVYDSLFPHLKDSINNEIKLEAYVKEINRIFKEESMSYCLHDNGRVRYYPDEEFQKSIKSTLLLLNKPKYIDNLTTFSLVLPGFKSLVHNPLTF